jgi:hypothetical protein
MAEQSDEFYETAGDQKWQSEVITLSSLARSGTLAVATDTVFATGPAPMTAAELSLPFKETADCQPCPSALADPSICDHGRTLAFTQSTLFSYSYGLEKSPALNFNSSANFLPTAGLPSSASKSSLPIGLTIGLAIGLALFVIGMVVIGVLWWRSHRNYSAFSIAVEELGESATPALNLCHLAATFLNPESVGSIWTKDVTDTFRPWE